MGASKLSIDLADRSPHWRPTRRWMLRALGVSGLAATAAGSSLPVALARWRLPTQPSPLLSAQSLWRLLSTCFSCLLCGRVLCGGRNVRQ